MLPNEQLQDLKKFIREVLDRLSRQSAGMIGGADMGGPIHMGKPAWQLGSAPEDEPFDLPEYEDVPDFLVTKKPIALVNRNKRKYIKNQNGKRTRRRY